MPLRLGVPELIIILAIVLAVFGAGKLSGLGGAVGKAVRDFRAATKESEADKDKPADASEDKSA